MHGLHGPGNGRCPEDGVALDVLELFPAQPPGLVEDGIRHADLADVVQGGRPHEIAHKVFRQFRGKLPVMLQLLDEALDIGPGALGVSGRIFVPAFHKIGKGHHDGVLQFKNGIGLFADTFFEIATIGVEIRMIEHARADDLGRELIADEVHRAAFQPPPFDVVIREGRDEDDRHIGKLGNGLDAGNDLKAVFPGHVDIQQNALQGQLRDFAQGLPAAAVLVDDKNIVEYFAKKLALHAVIVNDGDMSGRHVHGISSVASITSLLASFGQADKPPAEAPAHGLDENILFSLHFYAEKIGAAMLRMPLPPERPFLAGVSHAAP